jgi:23S rRNA (uridine2552-2'-O)-methyltransferase
MVWMLVPEITNLHSYIRKFWWVAVARSKTSQKWLDRHVNDGYVKQSVKDGYRSRAVYKLIELNDKSRFLKKGQIIVDLGAAPGGWLQVASKIAGETGTVIGLDLLPIDPISDVETIEGDFSEESVLKKLEKALNGHKVDVVLSDMAPNLSGVTAVDQPRAMYLCELALEFALQHLKPGGWLVVKVFQGEGFEEFLRSVRQHFASVSMKKPKASRPKSREMYLVAGNLKL